MMESQQQLAKPSIQVPSRTNSHDDSHALFPEKRFQAKLAISWYFFVEGFQENTSTYTILI
jgi:hypothetical protein